MPARLIGWGEIAPMAACFAPHDEPQMSRSGARECQTRRNINRFYVIEVMPSLFGDWTVMREWGRRGSPGTMRLDSYRRHDEAQSAEQRTISRRLKHGYITLTRSV
jgi:predicted DNA-binding WGR domain protein